MARVTIGWCIYNHCWPAAVEQEYASLFSEFALPPARLADILPRRDDELWNDCPAYNQFVHNLFVVLAPFPVTWQVSEDKTTIRSNIPNVPVPFSNAFFDHTKIRTQQKRLGLPAEKLPEHPIFDFRMHTLFVSNRPNTWLDLYPAFLHDTRRLNVLPIPGSFNIHAWPRPTVLAGPLRDTSQPVVIDRGDPLYYVRFRTKDPADSFELRSIPFTRRLRDAVTSRVNLKNIFPRLSWKLMQQIGPYHWFEEVDTSDVSDTSDKSATSA
jgi:hypothetical protein